MKLQNEIAFNALFWLLYFLYQWLGLASLYGDYDKYFINACMALPVSFIFSYLVVHVFFNFFYTRGRRAEFWVYLICCSLLLLLLRRYINYYLIYPTYFPELMYLPFIVFGKILVEFVNLYAISGLYALYYFIRFWYQERHRVQELLQQQTRAELDLLKSQVQPHFVFNMLNNIYSTALKTSPETAALIAHLSGFLDYNVYNATLDKIPLAAEIDYITHYIELQKNKYGSKLDVSVTTCEDIHDLQIAPFLLLPLIENCFKHGVASSDQQSWVSVTISRKPGEFSLKIENSKERELVTGAGGIGLSNVTKRLQLIYPGTHELKIFEQNHSYLVVLKLKIQQ